MVVHAHDHGTYGVEVEAELEVQGHPVCGVPSQLGLHETLSERGSGRKMNCTQFRLLALPEENTRYRQRLDSSLQRPVEKRGPALQWPHQGSGSHFSLEDSRISEWSS